MTTASEEPCSPPTAQRSPGPGKPSRSWANSPSASAMVRSCGSAIAQGKTASHDQVAATTADDHERRGLTRTDTINQIVYKRFGSEMRAWKWTLAPGAAAFMLCALGSVAAGQQKARERAPLIRVYSANGVDLVSTSTYIEPRIELSENAYVFAVEMDLDGQIQVLHPE